MDGGCPGLREKTSDSCGEMDETNTAPAAFSMNQYSAVVLPIVSGSQTLTWVHSNQIDLQLDGAAELDKAFDSFPYLTRKQTARLAQRCSLHQDEVKVWFMVQRLRYGISWEYEDIQEKAGKVREERSANVGGATGDGVRLERPMSTEKDRGNTHKKRKRMAVTDEMGKKKIKQDDEDIAVRAREAEIGSVQVKREGKWSIKSETKRFTRENRAMMKLAFCDYQYPSDEDYARLTAAIGIPRHMLVQWFADMRYYVKKAKPGWMDREQHGQALANIRCQQYLNMQAKAQLRQGRGEVARRRISRLETMKKKLDI
ncbi:putative homeobox and leucine zipper protein Homez-like [Scophthalmus maximus]|uniref:Putative homeobox and leucine zipper protein Homez-like n=1 Tax=Scophthalmus maximus TaxID=52904 RepID=A0A2U9B107_SCOMX|nr:putative homeobox and leucine zipper protein Homez-like [Scophthalmus maximus]